MTFLYSAVVVLLILWIVTLINYKDRNSKLDKATIEIQQLKDSCNIISDRLNDITKQLIELNYDELVSKEKILSNSIDDNVKLFLNSTK